LLDGDCARGIEGVGEGLCAAGCKLIVGTTGEGMEVAGAGAAMTVLGAFEVDVG